MKHLLFFFFLNPATPLMGLGCVKILVCVCVCEAMKLDVQDGRSHVTFDLPSLSLSLSLHVA